MSKYKKYLKSPGGSDNESINTDDENNDDYNNIINDGLYNSDSENFQKLYGVKNSSEFEKKYPGFLPYFGDTFGDDEELYLKDLNMFKHKIMEMCALIGRKPINDNIHVVIKLQIINDNIHKEIEALKKEIDELNKKKEANNKILNDKPTIEIKRDKEIENLVIDKKIEGLNGEIEKKKKDIEDNDKKINEEKLKTINDELDNLNKEIKEIDDKSPPLQSSSSSPSSPQQSLPLSDLSKKMSNLEDIIKAHEKLDPLLEGDKREKNLSDKHEAEKKLLECKKNIDAKDEEIAELKKKIEENKGKIVSDTEKDKIIEDLKKEIKSKDDTIKENNSSEIEKKAKEEAEAKVEAKVKQVQEESDAKVKKAKEESDAKAIAQSREVEAKAKELADAEKAKKEALAAAEKAKVETEAKAKELEALAAELKKAVEQPKKETAVEKAKFETEAKAKESVEQAKKETEQALAAAEQALAEAKKEADAKVKEIEAKAKAETEAKVKELADEKAKTEALAFEQLKKETDQALATVKTEAEQAKATLELAIKEKQVLVAEKAKVEQALADIKKANKEGEIAQSAKADAEANNAIAKLEQAQSRIKELEEDKTKTGQGSELLDEIVKSLKNKENIQNPTSDDLSEKKALLETIITISKNLPNDVKYKFGIDIEAIKQKLDETTNILYKRNKVEQPQPNYTGDVDVNKDLVNKNVHASIFFNNLLGYYKNTPVLDNTNVAAADGGGDIVVANRTLHDINNNSQKIDLQQLSNSQKIDLQQPAINNTISYTKQIFNLLKTDVYIKLVMLLNDKTIFNELYQTIFINTNININTYIDNFFINLDNYPKIKYIIVPVDNKYILDRDSNIYNLYANSSKSTSYIFMYKLVSILNDMYKTSDFDNLFRNIDHATETNTLLLEIYAKYDSLMKNHDYLNTQISVISTYYIRMYNKKKKEILILKARYDTDDKNPRYNIETLENGVDNYLFLKYYNSDVKLIENQPIPSDPNKEEYYFYGPFDKIYMDRETNKKISEDMLKMLKTKIIDKDENLLTFTYGQSGSGKTSSYIYLKNKKDPTKSEEGILIHLCNSDSFRTKFSKIIIKIKDVYIFHGSKNVGMNNIEEQDYNIKDIEIEQGVQEYSFIIHEGIWIYEKDLNKDIKRTLGSFIDEGLNKREVESTPNNPNSSRSHVIIIMSFILTNGSVSSQKIAIMDLAGDENVFLCKSSDNQEANFEEILKYDTKYQESDKYGYVEGEKRLDVYTNNRRTILIPVAVGDGGKEFVKYDQYVCNQQKQDSVKFPHVDQYKGKNCDKYEDYDAKCKYKELYYVEGVKTEEQYRKTLQLIIDEEKMIDDIRKSFIKNINEIYRKYNIVLDKYIKEKFKTIDNFISDLQNNYYDNKYVNFLKEIDVNSFIEYIKSFTSITIQFYNKFYPNYIKYINYYIIYINTKIVNDEDKDIYYLYKLFNDSFGVDHTGSDINLYDILQKDRFIDVEQKAGKNNTLPENVKLKNATIRFIKMCEYFGKIIKNKEIENLVNEQYMAEFKKYLIDDKIIKKEIRGDKLISTFGKNILKLLYDLERLDKAECSLQRLDRINYNCLLRKNEGYMINRSLRDLREDIKSIIRNSVSKDPLPIFYDKDMFPYCRNAYLEDEPYDKFYIPEKYDNKSSGILTKTLRENGMNLDNLNFVIFTVINLTNKNGVNNPPNPPYINISNLNYYWNNRKKFSKSKILNECKNVAAKMKNYNLYEKLELITDITERSYESKVPKILELIKNNNPATLIGSLDSTQLSQYTSYDNYCSYSLDLDKEITNLNSRINKNLEISRKYKYKGVLPPSFFKPKDGKKKRKLKK